MSKVSKRQADELKRLAEQPEAMIDTRDIPEGIDWTHAEGGRFFRPIKQQVTLTIDADVRSNPSNARLARPDCETFRRIWEEDWASLGRTRNDDWMHGQAARL